jgi:hypothetical protein
MIDADRVIRGYTCPTCDSYWPAANLGDAGFSAMICNGEAGPMTCLKCPEVAAARHEKLRRYKDAAIATALNESAFGDIITVHDTACAVQVGEECDCEVIRIVVGEHQA